MRAAPSYLQASVHRDLEGVREVIAELREIPVSAASLTFVCTAERAETVVTGEGFSSLREFVVEEILLADEQSIGVQRLYAAGQQLFVVGDLGKSAVTGSLSSLLQARGLTCDAAQHVEEEVLAGRFMLGVSCGGVQDVLCEQVYEVLQQAMAG